jgi:hypothetical protein
MGCYRFAASAGHGGALYNLAVCYEEGGNGVEPHPALARELYGGIRLLFFRATAFVRSHRLRSDPPGHVL